MSWTECKFYHKRVNQNLEPMQGKCGITNASCNEEYCIFDYGKIPDGVLLDEFVLEKYKRLMNDM